jgi:predicted ATPase
LQAALERLTEADILLMQGLQPEADYRFKHALIQEAAYENLLKSRRQILHRRVGETLRDKLVAGAMAEPELLAYHFTQAGMIEAAIEWWGKAGQRSLERSALTEALEQFTRAITHIEALPGTATRRHEQIKLQVALIIPLMHIKGYAAPETKAAAERARLLIEQAEARGETVEDSLLLFSVLFDLWAASYIAFNGDVARELAMQFLARAEKQPATAPLMIAHRIMGNSLLSTGDPVQARAHFDKAASLYDPIEHRPLVPRFGGIDVRVTMLCYRSLAMWVLGYPDQAFADAEHALKNARETRQVPSLMQALAITTFTFLRCGQYGTAIAMADELVTLANEKAALQWMAIGKTIRGQVIFADGKYSEAAEMITSAIAAQRSTGSTVNRPISLSYLAAASAELGHQDEANRCIDEAMTQISITKERMHEAEVNRIGGEITLRDPKPDAMKAEAYFERALSVARQQQAKSWELRAAMSMARLWRDQGKRDEARDLLAPVYGWFTEGFDTLDLKEAKVLLGELAS